MCYTLRPGKSYVVEGLAMQVAIGRVRSKITGFEVGARERILATIVGRAGAAAGWVGVVFHGTTRDGIEGSRLEGGKEQWTDDECSVEGAADRRYTSIVRARRVRESELQASRSRRRARSAYRGMEEKRKKQEMAIPAITVATRRQLGRARSTRAAPLHSVPRRLNMFPLPALALQTTESQRGLGFRASRALRPRRNAAHHLSIANAAWWHRARKERRSSLCSALIGRQHLFAPARTSVARFGPLLHRTTANDAISIALALLYQDPSLADRTRFSLLNLRMTRHRPKPAEPGFSSGPMLVPPPYSDTPSSHKPSTTLQRSPHFETSKFRLPLALQQPLAWGIIIPAYPTNRGPQDKHEESLRSLDATIADLRASLRVAYVSVSRIALMCSRRCMTALLSKRPPGPIFTLVARTIAPYPQLTRKLAAPRTAALVFTPGSPSFEMGFTSGPAIYNDSQIATANAPLWIHEDARPRPPCPNIEADRVEVTWNVPVSRTWIKTYYHAFPVLPKLALEREMVKAGRMNHVIPHLM
ncbi:hypothetical protein B0H19DRAFT_1077138 [Mycena capillaripes]|nr:hypothetical protein B0H19DRAFT_1077138 [Mycena capillaripes]